MDISEFKDANRKIFKDKMINESISWDTILEEHCKNPFKNSIYIRVSQSGNSVTIKNIIFDHSYFFDCKLRKIHFENCSFVNCYFYNCDFSKSSFSNCDFRYSKFKDTLVNTDIFNSAPRENNLLMKFSNNLRVNYRDLGDKSSEDIAIQYELNANEDHLYDSWISKNTYYRKKYKGFERFKKLLEWLSFELNKCIWGNGESFIRLILSSTIIILLLGVISSFIGEEFFSIEKLCSSVFFVFSYFIGSVDNSEIKDIIKSDNIRNL
ncbi:TPA: pentapeptide repeat-containing protein, partial [Haemophilus influenzae]